MRQRQIAVRAATLLLMAAGLAALCASGCRKQPAERIAKSPRVACMSPAATDLVVGMGAGDHLVAVSNFDQNREGVADLPRIGDYLSRDWEMISQVKPDVIVIQMAEEKIPAEFRRRAEERKIRLVNVHVDRLDDVFTGLRTLGETCSEPAKAAELDQKLHARLDAVRAGAAGKTPVRAIVVIGRSGKVLTLAGRGTFLDDLLGAAGGGNAAGSLSKDYPSVDVEQLRSELKPDVVLYLAPEVPAQEKAAIERFWEGTGMAVWKEQRVHILTEWYIEQPGAHVADIAERFAVALHGAAKQPAGAP